MRGRGLAVAVGLALALVTGCGGGEAAAPGPAAGPVVADPYAAEAPMVPAAVSVPSIGAESSLIGLGRDPAGGWAVPDTAGQASWYSEGTVPGDRGPAVVLGHVNLAGQAGVFARLADVEVGAQVIVTGTGGRSAVFRVTRVEQVPKVEFPTEQVLRPTPLRELRLITCGGALGRGADGNSYLDSVIVTALRV